jgi:hypothetical protein
MVSSLLALQGHDSFRVWGITTLRLYAIAIAAVKLTVTT